MHHRSAAFTFDILFSEEKAPASASLNGKGVFSLLKNQMYGITETVPFCYTDYAGLCGNVLGCVLPAAAGAQGTRAAKNNRAVIIHPFHGHIFSRKAANR